MAHGYSAVLPLQRSDEDGYYALTKTLKENIRQNFKNLVLTSPGERIMLPDFGVGIRDYLFEIPAKPIEDVQSEIFSKVLDQTARYMPFVQIQGVDFSEQNNKSVSNEQVLTVRISFAVSDLKITDVLSVSVTEIV